MSQGKWLNKNEVLKDLQEVCGRPSRRHVYEESLTEIRDKPPASVTCEDDDENFNYMMGYRQGDNNVDRDGLAEPDLPCISHWLDQVKKTEGQQNNNNLDDVLQNRNNPVELTKLGPTVQKSKPRLDPTVQEFIPRAAGINSVTVCGNATTNTVNIRNNDTDMVPKVNGIDVMQPETSFNIENEIVDKECTETNLEKKYFNEVQELKDKITSIPTADSFQNKTERNIALSKLMQLLANPPVPKSKNTSVKLLTPEHFVAPKPLLQEHSIPINKVPKISTPIPATKQTVTTAETVDNQQEQEDPSRIIESVKKVNDWFKQEEPVKEIKPTLHLAPPTYKRKEKSVKTPEVSSSLSTIRSSTSSPLTSACKKFVPSQQADELYKKFFKDSNEKKVEKPVSIWENLERQLKDKDKEIRQKKQESHNVE